MSALTDFLMTGQITVNAARICCFVVSLIRYTHIYALLQDVLCTYVVAHAVLGKLVEISSTCRLIVFRKKIWL